MLHPGKLFGRFAPRSRAITPPPSVAGDVHRAASILRAIALYPVFFPGIDSEGEECRTNCLLCGAHSLRAFEEPAPELWRCEICGQSGDLYAAAWCFAGGNLDDLKGISGPRLSLLIIRVDQVVNHVLLEANGAGVPGALEQAFKALHTVVREPQASCAAPKI